MNLHRRRLFVICVRQLQKTLQYDVAGKSGFLYKYRKTENISDLTDTQWKKMIDQAVANGCKTVYITGGEPLLREDLLPVWLYAKEQEIYKVTSVYGSM